MKTLILALLFSVSLYAGYSVTPKPSTGGGLSGLTVGRVPFAGSSTTIIDSSLLVWDITNARLGVGGAATSQFQITVPSSTKLGEIIKGASSQTADLFQAQNSSATAMVRIRSDGKLVGDGSLLTGISGGANTSLSNVSAVSFSSDLISSANNTWDVGSTGNVWAHVYGRVIGGTVRTSLLDSGGEVFSMTKGTSPGGTTAYELLDFYGAATPLAITTGSDSTSDSNATDDILIQTGNKTAGTGNSGSIKLLPGTSSGGTRGGIVETGGLTLTAASSTTVADIIKGAASQTADLFQVKNSNSTALVRIRADGKIVADGSLLTALPAQTSLYGHVHSASAGSCIWSATPTNSTPIAFGAQSSCNTATPSGNASAPSTKIPGIRFASGIADGGYLFQWHGNFTSNGSGHWCTWFMNDGSSNFYIGAQMVNSAQYGLPMLEILYTASGLGSTDTTFQLYVASALTQCDGVIQMNVAPIDFDVDVIKLW